MNKIFYLFLLLFLFVQCNRPQKTEIWRCDESDYGITLQLYDNASFYSTTVGDCHQNALSVLFEDDTWYDYEIVNDSIMNITNIHNDDVTVSSGNVTFNYLRNNDTVVLHYVGVHDAFVNMVTMYKFIAQ